MYCTHGIYKSGKRTSVCLSRRTVMLVWSYMIYARDNVVQNAGHYRENNKPPQGEPDPDAKRSCLATPWRVLFSIMSGDVLFIIPLITRLLAKTKQYLHMVCLFTFTIRSVDKQRNSPPKTLTSLSNRTRSLGLISYRTTCRVLIKTWTRQKNPLSLTAVKFGVHNSTDGPIANYCSCWCNLSK